MRWVRTKNWGMVLLGIWLIATGLMPFVNITAINLSLVLSIVAIAAGILILIGR